MKFLEDWLRALRELPAGYWVAGAIVVAVLLISRFPRWRRRRANTRRDHEGKVRWERHKHDPWTTRIGYRKRRSWWRRFW